MNWSHERIFWLVALPIAIERIRRADNDCDFRKSLTKLAPEELNEFDTLSPAAPIGPRGTSASGTVRT